MQYIVKIKKKSNAAIIIIAPDKVTFSTKIITKTCLYNFDPLNPLLYSKTGVLQGYILRVFLLLLKTIDCGYSSEPPRRGGSDEYPQSMFGVEIRKISNNFI